MLSAAVKMNTLNVNYNIAACARQAKTYLGVLQTIQNMPYCSSVLFDNCLCR